MHTATVEGMSCQKCVHHVSEALTGLGLSDVKVDLKTSQVSFTGTVAESEIKTAVEEAGYTFKNYKE